MIPNTHSSTNTAPEWLFTPRYIHLISFTTLPSTGPTDGTKHFNFFFQLQRSFEEKNAVISQLETSLAASRQELNLKKSIADQMERALQEQKQEIESRDSQSVQHGKKLEKLEEQADKATQQVRKMEVSLAECHKEIEMYVEQLKQVRSAHEQELEEKRLGVSCKVLSGYVVVQLYPWFKFSFLLFLGMIMYDNNVIISLKQKKRKFKPRIKLNHNRYAA